MEGFNTHLIFAPKLCLQFIRINARFERDTGNMKRIWHRFSPALLLLAAIIFMTMPALFAFADG